MVIASGESVPNDISLNRDITFELECTCFPGKGGFLFGMKPFEESDPESEKVFNKLFL